MVMANSKFLITAFMLKVLKTDSAWFVHYMKKNDEIYALKSGAFHHHLSAIWHHR